VLRSVHVIINHLGILLCNTIIIVWKRSMLKVNHIEKCYDSNYYFIIILGLFNLLFCSGYTNQYVIYLNELIVMY